MVVVLSVAVYPSVYVMKDLRRFNVVNDLSGSPIGIADQGEAPFQLGGVHVCELR